MQFERQMMENLSINSIIRKYRAPFYCFVLAFLVLDMAQSLLSSAKLTTLHCADNLFIGHNLHHLNLFKSPETNRRDATSALIQSILTCICINPVEAGATSIPNIFHKDRKQLDFCLVTILRVRYFSQYIGQQLKQLSVEAMDESRADTFQQLDKIKTLYLEARLGSKAILTGRIGGGATEKVITLASFDLKNCLNDARYWYQNLYRENAASSARSTLDQTANDIIESLAAIVEFDGLETTQDPSPRSSLALKMFSLEKATFIQRMLLERIVPSCDTFLNLFGSRILVCEQFIRLNYPDELR